MIRLSNCPEHSRGRQECSKAVIPSLAALAGAPEPFAGSVLEFCLSSPHIWTKHLQRAHYRTVQPPRRRTGTAYNKACLFCTCPLSAANRLGSPFLFHVSRSMSPAPEDQGYAGAAQKAQQVQFLRVVVPRAD
jgi:hypothetical protein